MLIETSAGSNAKCEQVEYCVSSNDRNTKIWSFDSNYM